MAKALDRNSVMAIPYDAIKAGCAVRGGSETSSWCTGYSRNVSCDDVRLNRRSVPRLVEAGAAVRASTAIVTSTYHHSGKNA